MSAIPTKQRELVKQREHFQCLRCGARGAHWHHRRRRRVADEHQHCTCNGVWLCTKDHEFVHRNKLIAKQEGFVVSSFITEPGVIPMQTRHGALYLTCTGTYKERNDEQQS